MLKKLNQRDKRALKIGAVGAAAILLFAFATTWLGHWGQVSKSLAARKAQLKLINPTGPKRQALLSIVPAFEMPQKQAEQKFLFRDKFGEQLKKAGIKTEPLKFLAAKKTANQAGYKLLRLKCTGKGKFAQLLDLLANLNENPYLVGIEELKIKCDEKKREQIQLDLVISTFVR